MPLHDALTPALLAPGDTKSAALDPAGFHWTSVREFKDPQFETVYGVLWAEFGRKHEMESREVLKGRFRLAPAMLYEMVLAQRGTSITAVRDHTAIWAGGEVVVHLSHNLILPEYRRSGLAGWMRAAPILTARECAAIHGMPDAPITLVGEMEHDDANDESRVVRLRAYERAGFAKIDPVAVAYFQPDFRPPTEIDASGGPRPLPFQLVIRQVGAEEKRTISGRQVRRLVQALYAMYGSQFRPEDFAHANLSLEGYPADDVEIALVPPTR